MGACPEHFPQEVALQAGCCLAWFAVSPGLKLRRAFSLACTLPTHGGVGYRADLVEHALPDTVAVGMPTVPSPGQLVSVRQRRYVVANVIESAALARGVTQSTPPPRLQHLLHLQSIDDDGLGEELSVVWELEPGTSVFERTSLPDPAQGFDDPARLEAFLHAVPWGAVASADVRAIHSPFGSGITIEDYQLDPLARAIEMPRVSLLIADDVGLGKTIEAGRLRERIYSNGDDSSGPLMAGVLIYMSAPGSEGMLGGLVRMGQPAELGRHICSALEDMRLCSSDPLCADHDPDVDGVTLHGAACHACLFAAETSCERGNRYLDRRSLVGAVRGAGGFFDDQVRR